MRAKRSLDSITLTKPTGTPTTSAGRASPASISSQRRISAVGVRRLAHRRFHAHHGAGDAAERGFFTDGGVRHTADDLHAQRPASFLVDARGGHHRVGDNGRPGAERFAGAADHVRREAQVLLELKIGGGMDDAHDHGQVLLGPPPRLHLGGDRFHARLFYLFRSHNVHLFKANFRFKSTAAAPPAPTSAGSARPKRRRSTAAWTERRRAGKSRNNSRRWCARAV